jgi:hypothetical protein
MFGWTRRPPRNPFESRTEVWREVGLGAETLEELDGDEIVVRITGTPERPADGAQLASEVLGAIRNAHRRADANGGARRREETAPSSVQDAT